MPKRSSEDPAKVANVGIAKSYNYKKTERTHEENQERAYIAASRRSDRSIEARIQSARQASEIHKQRTGKSLRITEEIVRNEEMYEEEEDEFPRSFRLLAPHMQTSNDEFNTKVETFLRNKVAMSQFVTASQQNWQHENEVNRLFAEAFPTLNQRTPRMPSYPGPAGHNHSRHTSVHPPLAQPLPVQHTMFDPSSHHSPSPQPNFQAVNYQQAPRHHSRGHSFTGPSPAEHRLPSPPALTPGSHTTTTPQSQNTPYFGSFAAPSHSSADYEPVASAFTSELPPEAKMLIGGGLDWDGTFDPALNPTVWQGQQYFSYNKVEDGQNVPAEYLDMTPQPLNSNEEPAWDAFLDDQAFATDTPFANDGFNMQSH